MINMVNGVYVGRGDAWRPRVGVAHFEHNAERRI